MNDPRTIIEELLRQRTAVRFRAGGPSMSPAIRDGELVHVQSPNPGALPPGSIVLYRMNGRLALHRIIRREKTGRHLVAGDAATAGGDWIPAADILGLAEWVQRGDRKHRLDTCRARWTGLARHALRPIRRLLIAVYRLLKNQAP